MNQSTTLNSYEADLANKYHQEIYDLFARLSTQTEMQRGLMPVKGRYSVGFFTPTHSTSQSPLVQADPLYFGGVILTGGIYNRNRTTFAERASTAFVNNAKTFLSTAFLSSGATMQTDERVKGVFVYLAWGLNDKIDDFASLTASYTEAIKICADWDSTKTFLDNKISAQEFADKIDIIGIYNNNDIGKVKVDTQKLL